MSPGSGPIPHIETERLVLRAHHPDDLEACAAMWADPLVVRYIGGKPFTTEEVWARMLRYHGHWWWKGFGYWAIEEKATGEFAGELGFADNKRAIQPDISDMPELGWILTPNAHGRGFATESVKAAVSWGDLSLSATQTVCLIDPENRKSLRVAEKCGYQEWHRISYRNQPTILLVRAANEPA